jgi:hypothetical protein
MNEQETSIKMRACLRSCVTRTLTHTQALSQTHLREESPENTPSGSVLNPLFQIPSDLFGGARESHTPSASHLVGVCGCAQLRVCESVRLYYFAKASVCLCRNECASLHACVLILSYIFISCYACAIDIWRAQTLYVLVQYVWQILY